MCCEVDGLVDGDDDSLMGDDTYGHEEPDYDQGDDPGDDLVEDHMDYHQAGQDEFPDGDDILGPDCDDPDDWC